MTLFPFYISGCELHEIGQHWIEGSLCFSLICRQLSEYVDVICVHTVFSPSCVSVPEDLSLEERDELSNIRRRKRELLDDIEVCVLPNEHLMVVLPFLINTMHCIDSWKNMKKRFKRYFWIECILFIMSEVWSSFCLCLSIYTVALFACCHQCKLNWRTSLHTRLPPPKKKGMKFPFGAMRWLSFSCRTSSFLF